MDFNDINARLERLYDSLKGRYNYDPKKYLNCQHINSYDSTGILLSFDKGITQANAANAIMLVIDNLAKLKDHLGNHLLSNKCVEVHINNSLFLQLVMDLSNEDKHGYPLTRTNRSGKRPQLINAKSVLSFTSDGAGSISSFSFNPVTHEVNTQGNVKAAIVADIVDANGLLIMSLDNLIDGALASWQELIMSRGIIT